MTIEIRGIDIAKNIFKLHGVNRSGHMILNRRAVPDELLTEIAQIEPSKVVMEACISAFY